MVCRAPAATLYEAHVRVSCSGHRCLPRLCERRAPLSPAGADHRKISVTTSELYQAPVPAMHMRHFVLRVQVTYKQRSKSKLQRAPLPAPPV
eukprot:1159623-Pelagomonas_calceolata.AAC.1